MHKQFLWVCTNSEGISAKVNNDRIVKHKQGSDSSVLRSKVKSCTFLWAFAAVSQDRHIWRVLKWHWAALTAYMEDWPGHHQVNSWHCLSGTFNCPPPACCHCYYSTPSVRHSNRSPRYYPPGNNGSLYNRGLGVGRSSRFRGHAALFGWTEPAGVWELTDHLVTVGQSTARH